MRPEAMPDPAYRVRSAPPAFGGDHAASFRTDHGIQRGRRILPWVVAIWFVVRRRSGCGWRADGLAARMRSMLVRPARRMGAHAASSGRGWPVAPGEAAGVGMGGGADRRRLAASLVLVPVGARRSKRSK